MFDKWRRQLRRGPRQRGLAIASMEAVAAAPAFAATEFWLVPLVAVRLEASIWILGLLAALPVLCTALLGPAMALLIRLCGGERRAAAFGSAGQGLGLLLLMLPAHCSDQHWAIPMALVLTCAIAMAGAIAGAGWMGVMASLIPPKLQGRYTTGRLRVFLACKLLMAFGFGGLALLQPIGTGPWALHAILLIGGISRLVSARLNASLPDMPERGSGPLQEAATRSWLAKGAKRWPLKGEFGRWLLVWVMLQIGVASASPYFVPYMLEAPPVGLGLAAAPLLYSCLVQISQLTRLLILPRIGRLVDRNGAAPVLRSALPLIALIPIPWALWPSVYGLMLVEIISGVVWCMAEVAVSVLLYRCADSAEDRARLIGWHQGFTSAGLMTGSLLGAGLMSFLPVTLDSAYRTLFLISSGLRLPAAILGIIILPAVMAGLKRERPSWRAAMGNYVPLGLLRGLPRFLRRPEG